MLSIQDVENALGRDLVELRPGSRLLFDGVANDSRVIRAGQLFFAIRGTMSARDGHYYVADAVAKGAAGVVVHRPVGVPAAVSVFRVGDTTHALGNLASFWRDRFPVKVIAIAGNVGKTTTKELTAAVLGARYQVLKSAANFNDEIGLSMTLLGLEAKQERAVVEVAMERLGEIRRLCEIAKPEIAVVMSVGPTHLSRLGSIQAIAAAKAEAVEALPRSGTAILNADDPYVAAMATKTQARVLTFGFGGGDIQATKIESHGLDGVDFEVEMMGRNLPAHTPIPGRELVRNALAALSVAVTDGLSLAEAVGALSCARVEPRMKVRRAVNGALILDDCYNAGPASMLAALDVLAEARGRHLALLGDMLELGSEEEAGHRLVGERAAVVAEALFTTGDRAEIIAEAARAAGARSIRHFETKGEALAAVKGELAPGDVLLVKASHGMAFDKIVAALVGE